MLVSYYYCKSELSGVFYPMCDVIFTPFTVLTMILWSVIIFYVWTADLTESFCSAQNCCITVTILDLMAIIPAKLLRCFPSCNGFKIVCREASVWGCATERSLNFDPRRGLCTHLIGAKGQRSRLSAFQTVIESNIFISHSSVSIYVMVHHKVWDLHTNYMETQTFCNFNAETQLHCSLHIHQMDKQLNKCLLRSLFVFQRG